MKNRLKKLLTVKSIVTIALTAVFSYLSVIGKISPEMLITIYTVIIGFYFGTQSKKEDPTPTETKTDNNNNTDMTE